MCSGLAACAAVINYPPSILPVLRTPSRQRERRGLRLSRISTRGEHVSPESRYDSAAQHELQRTPG